uniref:Translation initiation factor IF-1 n=3 Tax=Engelhardia TaxID=139931 RepID=A0AAU6QDG9_9ROSI|nr:Translation initiation factor IF-1 [Engelhardia hainanensis]
MVQEGFGVVLYVYYWKIK